MHITLFVDGASRGNPGHAGIGVYAYTTSSRAPLFTLAYYLGKATNNVAEYAALAAAMHHLSTLSDVSSVQVYADSELLVKQIKGIYKVKNPRLQQWHALITGILTTIPFTISHVLREKNSQADSLANTGIDEKKPLPNDFKVLMKRYITRA